MVTVIIAAAGQGKRMNASGVNKVFIPLLNTPILCYSVQTFASCPDVDRLVVVAAPEEVSQLELLLQGMNLSKPWIIVAGGSERQYSIDNALRAIPQETGIIVVHDGARPLTGGVLVTTVIDAARQFRAAIAAVPVKDTIKTVDESGFAIGTPERSRLWAIQTPQAFEAALLRQAHFQAAQDGFLGTDDAVLVERLGVPVKIIPGSYQNIKITTPEDLIVARALLGISDDNKCPTAKGGGRNSMERMGLGYDVHRLVEGRKLILGGVEVPYAQGLEGHSDADVLLHAIQDAMLGAAGLGDIGRHFPDSNGKYKGISSLVLLSEVKDLLAEQSWQVNNVDAVIVAEKPKLAPFIELMNCTVAATLGIETNRVNIKATTTEGLGFAGRCEGIAAQAVVSLVRAD